MPAITYSESMQGGGLTLGGKPRVRTVDHPNPYEVVLPVALAVTGWTKTDADTATCNEPAGVSAGKYDVYWSGGLRYGVDLTIVGTTGTIQLDGGAGDDFPASATTGVVICAQKTINTDIDGDNVEILGLELSYPDPASTSLGHVDMQDSGGSTIEEIDLTANKIEVYDITGGAANVFTGNPITSTKASHNDTTYTPTLKILSGEDRTP